MPEAEVKEVAEELGIDPGRISKWRQRHSSPEKPPVGLTEEQKEIRRLQKELKEAQLERDMDPMRTHVCGSKKADLFQGRQAIFRFIKGYRNRFPVEKMCQVLRVSTSGYYYWLKHPVGLREGKEQQLLSRIKQVYQKSKCCYGSPRITLELQEQGLRVSRPRVARLMQKTGLSSITRKPYRVQTTDSNHGYPVAEHHLNRDFSANRLGEKWVSDLTYIKTQAGWLYLTAVLDLADRKVVGWALSETMTAKATRVAAWRMAISNRPVTPLVSLRQRRTVCLL